MICVHCKNQIDPNKEGFVNNSAAGGNIFHWPACKTVSNSMNVGCHICRKLFSASTDPYVFDGNNYFHEVCFRPVQSEESEEPKLSSLTLVEVKQAAVALSRVHRQQLYIFMHDALDCRM